MEKTKLAYKPDQYLDHDQLEDFLKSCRKNYPDLFEMEEIGKTLEGRSIWLATLTNKKTGAAEKKPGYWIDGNIHASELASCQACVHTMFVLLDGYGTHKRNTQLLDNQVLYVVPRVCPDGAEMVLKTPFTLRSTSQPWPESKLLPGFYPDDVDGDGQILTMRIPDESGPWRVSKADPRIMVLRKPDEENNPEFPSYHLAIEGRMHGESGGRRVTRNLFGIDMNRQFPEEWAPPGVQFGAGPYTLAQAESRAIFDAVCKRPNICGAISFHTFSRVFIRPWTNKPDEDLPYDDLLVWRDLGNRATELTEYPALSGYHGFKYHPKEKLHGGFSDWAYAQRGIFAWVAEIWHIAHAAGVEVKDPARWFMDEISEADNLKILKWCDQNLKAGQYFEEWRKYDHPQLGVVEIGGWKTKFTWSNPPQNLLAPELEKMTSFVLASMRANPSLVFKNPSVESFPGDANRRPMRKVSVVLENTGYLPTYGSEQALKTGMAKKPRVRVSLNSDDVQLFSGLQDFEIDHLLGRANIEGFKSPLLSHLLLMAPENKNQRKLEWIVQGSGAVTIEVECERAGYARYVFE